MASGEKTPGHPAAVLAAVLLATIALPITLTGASVALPRIGADLDADLAAVQWVVNGYNATFASFMLAAGSLADVLGRRRVFAAGMAIFTVGGLLSAFAGDIVLLDVLRALAGIGMLSTTGIIVAHRASTVMLADRVALLTNNADKVAQLLGEKVIRITEGRLKDLTDRRRLVREQQVQAAGYRLDVRSALERDAGKSDGLGYAARVGEVSLPLPRRCRGPLRAVQGSREGVC